MAATYRSATQNGARVAGTTGFAINKPSGVANGDTLVAFIGAGDDAGGAYASSGWSQASGTGSGAAATSVGNDIGSTILYKHITNAAGEPASYTFTNSDTAAQNRVGFIVCVQSTDSDPIAELTQNTGTNDWTPTHVNINTPEAGCCVLMFHVGNVGTAASKTAGAPATPSGTTLIGAIQESRTTGNYAAAEAAYYESSAAETVTVGAWTGTADDTASEWHVYSVAVRGIVTRTGTLAQSLAALVVVATSLVAVGATSAPTLGALTVSGTATVASAGVSGTLASTLGALTVTGAGSAAVAGAGTNVLGVLTVGTDADVGVAGSASNALGALTASTDADIGVAGTGTNTLGALTGAGTGAVAWPAAIGDLGVSLGALTAAADGDVAVSAAGTNSLGALTAAATGAVEATGAFSSSLAPLTQAAGAGVGLLGDLGEALDALTLSGAGTVAAGAVTGNLTVTLGGAVQGQPIYRGRFSKYYYGI